MIDMNIGNSGDQAILVIDDDVGFQNYMSELLSLEGYSVHNALDGEEGIKKYDEFKPDVVITDIVMPKMEGFEFIMALRKRNANIPIIAVSGGNNGYGSKYLRVAEKFGVDAIFDKPFDSKEFLEKINEFISEA